MNIRFRCAFEPRGVHAQHHLDAVSVLLRDPKRILAQHELPGHGGMLCVVRAAPSNVQRLGALAPAPAGDSLADRPSVFKIEQLLMVDFAVRDVFLAQSQVTLKDFERAWAKLNVAILLRLPPRENCTPGSEGGDGRQPFPTPIRRPTAVSRQHELAFPKQTSDSHEHWTLADIPRPN